MIVVVIIGVLSAIGVAAYNQYIIKTKLSEGYVALDTMRKMQTTYYANNGRFASTQTLPNPPSSTGAGAILSCDSTPTNCGWQNTGYPFPIGSSTYFNYKMHSGQIDGSGTQTGNSYDGTENADPFSGSTAFDFRIGASSHCTSGLDADSFGMTFPNNSFWATIAIAGNFKTETPETKCTGIYAAMIVENGNMRMQGPILLNVGD